MDYPCWYDILKQINEKSLVGLCDQTRIVQEINLNGTERMKWYDQP